MDALSYRGLDLNILHSTWDREPMIDLAGRTTYESTRVRGSLVVTYNPGAITYTATGNPPVPNVVPAMPVVTDVAIRNFLEQPRGLLIVKSGNTEWLRSPRNGSDGKPLACDARNGPFLRANNIQYIQGERCWKINLEIETFVNNYPTDSATAPQPTIISNRWYAIDDTNWQHLRTRIYQGVCTVNAGWLQTRTATRKYVDDLRVEFAAFTVPPGFQREQVHVTVTPDGNSAHYTVVDTEKLFNLDDNCPAVRIAVADSAWVWAGSLSRAVAQSSSISRAAGWVGALSASFQGAPFDVKTMADFGAVTLSGTAAGNLPKYYKNTVVRVWGNQRASRTDLVNYGLRVAIYRMGRPNLLDVGTTELIISQDSENYVQISQTFNWSPEIAVNFFGGPMIGNVVAAGTLIGPNGAQGIGGRNAFNQAVREDPDTVTNGPPEGVVHHTQAYGSIANITNPIFPSSEQTRGTANQDPVSLQTLVTQALESFNGSPADVQSLPT